MSHVPHQLHEEFPQDTARLHELKISNAHFVLLADRYHDVNRAIHRAEAEVEPTSGKALEDMKKQRLHLKDKIALLLRV